MKVKKVSQIDNKRKNMNEIVTNIFNVLQDGDIHTISDISRETKSHWRTIKNHIDIIAKIQEMPKIEILQAKKQTLVRIME
jgi:hypothetical protein